MIEIIVEDMKEMTAPSTSGVDFAPNMGVPASKKKENMKLSKSLMRYFTNSEMERQSLRDGLTSRSE